MNGDSNGDLDKASPAGPQTILCQTLLLHVLLCHAPKPMLWLFCKTLTFSTLTLEKKSLSSEEHTLARLPALDYQHTNVQRHMRFLLSVSLA